MLGGASEVFLARWRPIHLEVPMFNTSCTVIKTAVNEAGLAQFRCTDIMFRTVYRDHW